MPLLTVDQEFGHDVELYFEDHGDGPPVVLIHGWPLDQQSWEHQKGALIAAGYRVITYDRRGFGRSSRPWAGYEYDTLADDLAALLDELDVRDATLVGCSMGGGEVARYLGTRGSDRVAAAVFAASITPYLYKAVDNPEGGLDDETIHDDKRVALRDRAAFLEQFTKDFFTAGRHSSADLISEPARHATWVTAVAASPKATLDCIDAFGKTDFRGDLARIDVPTLVIHGDCDAIVPIDVSGRRTAAAVRGARLQVIEGGPHGINITHPEEFNGALLGFLASALPVRA